MEIPSPVAGVRISLEGVHNTLLETLREGQILQARTVDAARSGSVRLRIGGAEVTARTPVALDSGQQLRLQVVKAGNPLLLRLLGEPPVHHPEAAAMRSALPRQRPVTELIQRLLPLLPQSRAAATESPATLGSGPERFPGRAANPPPQPLERLSFARPTLAQASAAPPATPAIPREKPQALPTGTAPGADATRTQTSLPDNAKLLRAVERLLSLRVSTDAPITADRVRQSFAQSGLFLEPLLAQGRIPTGDMKLGLLELLLRLRQQLPAPATPQPGGERVRERFALLNELITQTESSLARVVLNQLASLPQEESNQQHWQLDLPVRQPGGEESVRLRIEKEAPRNSRDGAEVRWTVGIDFDIDPIGPVHARLTLLGEEISSRFTAEQRTTAARIEAALHLLERALSKAGFKVGSLSSTHGRVDTQTRPAYPLLDEHA